MHRVLVVAAVAGCAAPPALVAPVPRPTPVVSHRPELDLTSAPVRLGGAPTWSNAGELIAVRYCPGDRELIALDDFGNLRRFRTSDGVQIAISTIGEPKSSGMPVATVIECRADGTALAIGGDNEPMLVDPHGAITRPPQPIDAMSARFADDGAVVAMPEDETIIRWDGASVRVSPAAHSAMDTALLEGGALLEHMFQTGSAATDGVFLTRGTTRTKLQGRFVDFFQASMAPDGAVLAAHDMASFAWDMVGTHHGFAKVMLDMTGAHLSSVVATNRWFVSVGGAEYVQLVDRANKTTRQLEQPCGETTHVMALAVSTDDMRIALACEGTGVRVLDAATAQPITRDGLRAGGSQLAWSADSSRLATRNDLRVWQGEAMVAHVDDTGGETTLWWTADGALGGTYGGIVGTWSLPDGTWHEAEPRQELARAVRAANGDVVGVVEHTVVTRQRTIDLSANLPRSVDVIAVDPSGAHVALLFFGHGNNPTLLVAIDVAAGTTTSRAESATAIAFADDGAILVGGSDGSVRTADGRELAKLADSITAIASSHELVAAAAADATIAIVGTHGVAGTLVTHGDPAVALAFSPDGRRLASTAPDATLIWQLIR